MEKKEAVKDSVFAQLNVINVNEHTEQKPTGYGNKSLTYLSWAWAYAEVKKLYPDLTYTIYRDEQNRPYIEDPDFGLMCMTTVTIQGQTHEMWLPVMDGSNKAMKRQPYSYKVWDSKKNQYVDKWVQPATMFDINKTIMRCLVKNLAMFGLGLYIYAGEDLPETDIDGEGDAPASAKKATKAAKSVDAQSQAQETKKPQTQPVFTQQNLSLDDAKKKIAEANTREQLAAIYNGNQHLQSNPDFVGTMKARKDEILKNNGQTAA